MQNEAFIKNLVARHWDKSGDVERNALIDLMVAFESPDWSQYVYKAKRGDISGDELILERQAEIMDSSARGVADHDGTVKVNFDTKYYQRQVNALTSYLQIITWL
ncbi:hypothetical protein MBO12_03385 [Candidatus Saccharibacteria bacterium]|nr:hypothetical protein [Candidatus Saccharibacteria bacterium]